MWSRYRNECCEWTEQSSDGVSVSGARLDVARGGGGGVTDVVVRGRVCVGVGNGLPIRVRRCANMATNVRCEDERNVGFVAYDTVPQSDLNDCKYVHTHTT